MTKPPKNETAAKLHQQAKLGTLDKLLNYLSRLGISDGIHSTTNRNVHRRKRIVEHIQHWEIKLLNARRPSCPRRRVVL